MSTKSVLSFEEVVAKMASSQNAARTAIRVLKSYFGTTADTQLDGKDIGKLTMNELANITGVGEKTFVLICQAYSVWVKQ